MAETHRFVIIARSVKIRESSLSTQPSSATVTIDFSIICITKSLHISIIRHNPQCNSNRSNICWLFSVMLSFRNYIRNLSQRPQPSSLLKILQLVIFIKQLQAYECSHIKQRLQKLYLYIYNVYIYSLTCLYIIPKYNRDIANYSVH